MLEIKNGYLIEMVHSEKMTVWGQNHLESKTVEVARLDYFGPPHPRHGNGLPYQNFGENDLVVFHTYDQAAEGLTALNERIPKMAEHDGLEVVGPPKIWELDMAIAHSAEEEDDFQKAATFEHRAIPMVLVDYKNPLAVVIRGTYNNAVPNNPYRHSTSMEYYGGRIPFHRYDQAMRALAEVRNDRFPFTVKLAKWDLRPVLVDPNRPNYWDRVMMEAATANPQG